MIHANVMRQNTVKCLIRTVRASLAGSLAFAIIIVSSAWADDDLSKARELASAGKIHEAAATYMQVLKQISLSRSWPEAMHEAGLLHYGGRQWKKAVEIWEKEVKDYPKDSLSPKAMWYIITTQSGPLNDRRSALKTAQSLYQQFPNDEFGERAKYAEGIFYLWDGDKSKARNALARYLSVYPNGRYTAAVQQALLNLK